MTTKSLDRSGRWRSKTVAFRMSEEENDELNRLVAMSGLTKQDYITSRLLEKDVVVVPSSRVLRSLQEEIGSLRRELQRAEEAGILPLETAELAQVLIEILDGLDGEEATPEISVANHAMATMNREGIEGGRGPAAPWKVQPTPLPKSNSSSHETGDCDAE